MWTPLSRCVRWVRGLDSGGMEGGGAPFAIRLAVSFAATLAVVGALGYIVAQPPHGAAARNP